MDYLKATGYISYHVRVTCPHCKGRLDLNQYPYDEDDDENELGLALFGAVDTPAKWSNLNIVYRCNHCKEEFVLTQFVY